MYLSVLMHDALKNYKTIIIFISKLLLYSGVEFIFTVQNNYYDNLIQINVPKVIISKNIILEEILY